MKIPVVIMLCHAMVLHSQVNILESYNGDFENGMNYWRYFEVPGNSGSFAEQTMDAVSGNYAMKINYASDYGNIVDRGFDNWLTSIPVYEGVTYTAKAFVKGDTNATERLVKVKVTFGFFDAAYNVLSQSERDYPLTDVYKEISLTKKATTRAAFCWLAFRLYDATAPCAPFRSIYLDNVRITRPYGVSVEPPGLADFQAPSLGNFPNPFSKETTIAYDLNKTCSVTLRIFDMLGQEITLLVDQQIQHTGHYEVVWTPGDLPPGIYYYAMEGASSAGKKFVINRKMVLGR